MHTHLLKLAGIGILFSAVLLAVASPATAMSFFDFHGFSYLDGPPETVGTVVTVPALLNEIQPDPIWPLDFATNEYTILVQGLTISDVSIMGPFRTITYTGGEVRFCQDSSRNATLQGWVVGPPNAQVPANFGDGEILLEGVFTEMVMLFNSSTGSGTISGSINWSGGTRLAQISNPVGWTYFGGVSDHSQLGIPAGYDLAWDPQIYGPETTPVRESTWGGVKHHFD